MAMIDYGAIVIKNGKKVNDDLFMDMEKSVGWVDIRPIRTEDCDHTVEPYEGYVCSDCRNCPKSQKVEETDPYTGKKYFLVADCLGRPIGSNGRLNGEYFAYVGDEHLTLAFYKHVLTVAVDKKIVAQYWGCSADGEESHRVRHLQYGGVDITLKRLGPRVMKCSLKYNGDFYHIIYGYGIDPNLKVWNRVKNIYVGKKLARTVDKIFHKYGIN